MSPKITLILASIAFAVLWTGYMIWRIAPDTAGIVILLVSGAIAGTLWYFGMRRVMSVFVEKKQ
jgi:hypothetical protein